MLLIGITGRSRSGKSTVAKAIVKEATAKGLAAEVFEISSYILQEAIGLKRLPKKEREQLTAEEIEQLVKIGVEKREENPRHWIDLMVDDITRKKPDVSLVPNLRFLNEAEAIRSLNGKIVRIKSYLVDGIEHISTDRDPNHISEIEHHAIQADYFLTAKRGESQLLGRQAATLFLYLLERQNSVN